MPWIPTGAGQGGGRGHADADLGAVLDLINGAVYCQGLGTGAALRAVGAFGKRFEQCSTESRRKDAVPEFGATSIPLNRIQ